MANSLIERIQWSLEQRERCKWYEAQFRCLQNEGRQGSADR